MPLFRRLLYLVSFGGFAVMAYVIVGRLLTLLW
jgi:hypothetical protein